MCLYGSCNSDPLKFGTWALTREWALAQDTTVLVHDNMPPATSCSVVQTRIELDHYPDIQDDTTFVTELIAEQGVTCMPGSVSGD